MSLPVIVPLVEEGTTTTGTGTLSLNGATTGNRTFVDGVGDGGTCYYYAQNGATEWEEGIGTVTNASPDTLSRDIVIRSSNAGSLVSFTSEPTVRIDVPSVMVRGKRYLSAAQSIPDSTTTTILFDSETYNAGGMSYSSGEWTINRPGLFLMTSTVLWGASATGDRFLSCQVDAGGVGSWTTIAQRIERTPPSQATKQQVNVIKELAKDDKIRFTGFQDSGGALDVGNASGEVNGRAELTMLQAW